MHAHIQLIERNVVASTLRLVDAGKVADRHDRIRCHSTRRERTGRARTALMDTPLTYYSHDHFNSPSALPRSPWPNTITATPSFTTKHPPALLDGRGFSWTSFSKRLAGSYGLQQALQATSSSLKLQVICTYTKPFFLSTRLIHT